MAIRIFDIIPFWGKNGSYNYTDITKENVKEDPVNMSIYTVGYPLKSKLYNPSGIGGGYTNSAPSTRISQYESQQISFDIIFRTDDTSSAYEKYLDTSIAIRETYLVWLRYAVPLRNGYRYAYRPCFVNSLTKTEAKYQDAEMVEHITLTPVDSWMYLYGFTEEAARVSLSPENATYKPDVQMYSNDMVKQVPYTYPYFYQGKINTPKSDTWYERWGNVLDPSSDVYANFAIHAPSFLVSKQEEMTLSFYGANMEEQMNRVKDNAFITMDKDEREPELAKNVRSSVSSFVNSRNRLRGGRGIKFNAKLENYSDDGSGRVDFGSYKNDEFYWGHIGLAAYDSFSISGNAQKGQKISFVNSDSTILENELTFTKDVIFAIDTAAWADFYVTGALANDRDIDFSRFVSTGIRFTSKLAGDASVKFIVCRRSIYGI